MEICSISSTEALIKSVVDKVDDNLSPEEKIRQIISELKSLAGVKFIMKAELLPEIEYSQITALIRNQKLSSYGVDMLLESKLRVELATLIEKLARKYGTDKMPLETFISILKEKC